jgi:uncharacterized membrane protein YfhO
MQRAYRWLPWLAILLGPLALFGPALLRGQALFWGAPFLQFTPWHSYAAQVVGAGHLPLWNPLAGMGSPLLANYQSALLYPPNLLLLLINVAWGQTLLVMLHLIWAGAGMVYLSRRLKFNALGQVIAAISFSLSGYLVARSGFLSINATVAWLPWIIVAVERLIASLKTSRWSIRNAAGSIALLAIFLGFQWLGGHAQVSWYSLILALTWVAWRSFGLGSWRGMAAGLGSLFGSTVLAFGFAAAQLLPTLEFMAVSNRAAGLDPNFAMNYSFWPWRALGVLAPDVFGSPASGDYWGYGNYWEDAIYIGVLPLVLAVIHVLRGKSKLKWPLTAISVLAFILALGRNTPLFPLMYDSIPTFNLFQAPTRWSLLIIFCLALLAGRGARDWRLPSGRGLYWMRLGTAAAGAIGISAWLASSVMQDLNPTFFPAFAIAGLILTTAGVLALLRKRMGRSAWQVAVILLILADLVIAGNGLNPFEETELQDAQQASGQQRVYLPSELEHELKFEESFRFDSFNLGFRWELVREWGLPNVTMLDGVPSVSNFDPIISERYARWMELLETNPNPQLLELMGIGTVATRAGTQEVRYLRRSGSSRVRLADGSEVIEDPEQVLSRLLEQEFDPTHTVLLEQSGMPQLVAEGPPGTWQLQEGSNPNRVDILVDTPIGRWLVLSDQWYPGWKAYVDGEQVTNHRANYLFRSVWVPAGNHMVSFQYQPWTFAAGTILSSITTIAMIALLWRRAQ